MTINLSVPICKNTWPCLVPKQCFSVKNWNFSMQLLLCCSKLNYQWTQVLWSRRGLPYWLLRMLMIWGHWNCVPAEINKDLEVFLGILPDTIKKVSFFGNYLCLVVTSIKMYIFIASSNLTWAFPDSLRPRLGK